MPSDNRERAIVIGASMGGLLAARVLADHFRSVTVIEQDAFPPVGEHRRGVPQSRHTHGLLAIGKQILERLFPEITAQLIEMGAVAGDIVRDGRWIHEGACLTRFTSGLDGLLVSRPLLEGVVRKRLLQLPAVKPLENCRVLGLAASSDACRVTGIRVSSDHSEQLLAANLVVDATGRGSHSPEWLAAMNYPKPGVDRVEVAISYTTRLFRRRTEHLDGDVAVIIPPTPEGKRGGVMLAQEDQRWTVTMIGYGGTNAPPDLPGFRDFAQTLPATDIYEVIRDAEPIGDAMSARFPASVRHRYERLERFPDGFLVFGDAICSFNPIYGQGMSVSALEAIALQECLASGTNDLARRFFSRASKLIDMPWGIAVGSDLRIPETVGPRTRAVSFINWYMAKLHKAAHHDPVPALAFHRVANLLAPPPSVMHPKVALRVLWGNLARKSSTAQGQLSRVSRSRGAAIQDRNLL